MKAILVQLDDSTYNALQRVAPPKNRKRSQFIRDAIRRALIEAEFARMREAYARQPDSPDEEDAWESPEAY